MAQIGEETEIFEIPEPVSVPDYAPNESSPVAVPEPEKVPA